MPKKPDPYLTDDDSPQLSHTAIMSMEPASDVLPSELYRDLKDAFDRRKAEGGSRVSLDLDPDLARELQSQGDDWRVRANALLRKAVGL